MLEAEDVIAASKAILLRHPGGNDSIQDWINKGFTRQTLQRAFLASKEFLLQQNRQNIIEYKSRKLSNTEAQLENLQKFNIFPMDRHICMPTVLSRSELNFFEAISNYVKLQVIVVIGDEKADQCARMFCESNYEAPLIVISNCPEYESVNRSANKASPPFIRLPIRADKMIGFLNHLRIIPDLIILSAEASLVAPLAFEQGHEHTLIVVEKLGINLNALEELKRIVPPHMGEIIHTDNYITITNMWLPIPLIIEEEKVSEFLYSDKKIAIVAIVKDEAEMIQKMLTSATNFASLVVIADTGSTDETINIARATCDSMGIPIDIINIHFESFSQARNAALDAVPPSVDWILMLDADEYIVDSDKSKILDLIQDNDYDTWCLPRYNFMSKDDKNKLLAYPDRQARLLKNKQHAPIRYVNPVHETLAGYEKMGSAPSNLSTFDLGTGGPHIHHIGMFKSDLKAAARSQQNDLLADTKSHGSGLTG